jgi:hypothetical protein
VFIVFYHAGAVFDAIFDARIDGAHVVSRRVLRALHLEALGSSRYARRSAMENKSHSTRMACDVYL